MPIQEHRSPSRARAAIVVVIAGIAAVLLAPTQTLPAQIETKPGTQSLYSIPRSQDDIHELKMAKADIRDARYESAVNRLHLLLRRGRKGLVAVAPRRFTGMRAAIIQQLRALPQDGAEAYEKLTRLEAGDLIRKACSGRNVEDLRALAWRFPTSTPGRRARLRLGDIRLETGDGIGATVEYASLLESLGPGDPNRTVAVRRLRAAQTLVLGQAQGAGDAEILASSGGVDQQIGWRSYGGGGTGTSRMTLPRHLGKSRKRFQLSSPGYGASPGHRLATHAVGGLDGIYLNTGHKVVAFDPIAGKTRWEADGPMVGTYDINEYYETLSPAMLLSVALSPDVVVAALQVPNANEHRSFRSLDLVYKLPSRRLFAFDRHSGKRLWAHWDHLQGPRTTRFATHNAPTPPIIEGNTVYAPTNDPNGAISYYLTAYDLKTGDEKWRTLICSSQGEVNMFGNVKVEYAATPVALHEGVIYGTTNLGLCYAADTATGRVRWCTAYPVIPLPSTRLHGQRRRSMFFANNPVIVSHGVMVCTPLDSDHVLGLDTRTGEILWLVNYDKQAGHTNQLKWILGVVGDEAILAGAGVVGIKLRWASRSGVRQIRTHQYFNGLASRIAKGAVTKTHIIHPLPDGLSIFDRAGNATGKRFPIRDPGNVLMVDGLVVTARADEVQVYLDQDALLAQAQRSIQREPANPAHYLRLATLLRGGKRTSGLRGLRGDRTVRLLRKGLGAARRAGLGPESPLFRSLAKELFDITIHRADNAASLGAKNQALGILRQARGDAYRPESWIKAQLRILALSRNSNREYLVELDRLTAAHGSAWYEFPGLSRMRVRPYVLFQSISCLADNGEIVLRCQELLENYPDVRLDDATGRQFATKTIANLIRKRGPRVYAAVEKRAQGQLRAAGTDVALLRGMDQRFPHSAAAVTARQLVLDAAVLRGDLASAAAMANRSGTELSAGMLRRLMVAAGNAGNPPLARALGRRILDAHGDEPSDFGPDAGRPLSEVVRLAEVPLRRPILADLPSHQAAATIQIAGRTPIEILTTTVADGFAAKDAELAPLYVAVGPDQLVAYDLSSVDEPVFQIDVNLRAHWLRSGEPLRLAKDRLIINEGQAIQARHYRTGKPIWSHAAHPNRAFRVIAISNGIVHAFSILRDNGDGGTLLALDVLSGAVLFTHAFPATRETITPRAFIGDLWFFHRPRDTRRIEVHRIDGITGRLRHRIVVPTTIQKKLGLDGGGRLREAQSALLADETGVYLCAVGSQTQQPVVAGFEHNGELKWVWTSSTPRSTLKLRALHRSGIVLTIATIPRPPSLRVVVLDKGTGKKAGGIRLLGAARLLTPRAEPAAPDTLLFEENASSTRLVCYSIDGSRPTFRHETHKPRLFWRDPVVGENFLAAPVVVDNSRRMEMLVINLKARRRGMLPGGKLSRTLPNHGGGFKLVQHGPYILYQTQRGILIYGSEERVK